MMEGKEHMKNCDLQAIISKKQEIILIQVRFLNHELCSWKITFSA